MFVVKHIVQINEGPIPHPTMSWLVKHEVLGLVNKGNIASPLASLPQGHTSKQTHTNMHTGG